MSDSKALNQPRIYLSVQVFTRNIQEMSQDHLFFCESVICIAVGKSCHLYKFDMSISNVHVWLNGSRISHIITSYFTLSLRSLWLSSGTRQIHSLFDLRLICKNRIWFRVIWIEAYFVLINVGFMPVFSLPPPLQRGNWYPAMQWRQHKVRITERILCLYIIWNYSEDCDWSINQLQTTLSYHGLKYPTSP